MEKFLTHSEFARFLYEKLYNPKKQHPYHDIRYEQLKRAGFFNRASVFEFLFYKFCFAILGVFLALFIYTAILQVYIPDLPYVQLLIIIAIVALFFYLPNIIFATLATRYQNNLFKSFPIFLELVSIYYSSQYSLEKSMDKASTLMKEGFPEVYNEIQHHLRERNLLQLDAFKERQFNHIDRIDLRAILASLFQQEYLGVPMHDKLLIDAEQLRQEIMVIRDKYRERAPVFLTILMVLGLMPLLYMLMFFLVFANLQSELKNAREKSLEQTQRVERSEIQMSGEKNPGL